MALLTDVLIVGAGPSGLAMGCCLAKAGLNVAIFDKQTSLSLCEPEDDGREIAMTHCSKTILKELGVWKYFKKEHIHPLKEAKVFNGASPYCLHFERNDHADEPLGFLVANKNIRNALYSRCEELDKVTIYPESTVVSVDTNSKDASLTLEDGSRFVGKLLIAADSRFSITRKMMGLSAQMKDFGRVMIVANVSHQSNHKNTAQEWFKYGLTCAILPLSDNNSSIVLTVPAALAYELLQLDNQQYLNRISTILEGRLGHLEAVGVRTDYPLVGVYSDSFTSQRFALVGDAAVGMHPVTAHGFNLGLRSVDTLSAQIKKAHEKGQDIASKKVLLPYQFKHQLLAKPLYEGTNFVVKLFTDDNPAAKIVRKGALVLGNHLPSFKRLVSHHLTQQRG